MPCAIYLSQNLSTPLKSNDTWVVNTLGGVMGIEKKTDHSNGLSRRNFVKLGAASALVGTAAVAALPEQVAAETTKAASGPKIVPALPIKVSSDFKRFNQEKTAFVQAIRGEFPSGMDALIKVDGPMHTEPGKAPVVGHQEVDKALVMAGWAIHKQICELSEISGPQDSMAYSLENEVKNAPVKFASKTEATEHVKKAATFLGASLVGIAPYDERWTYATQYDPFKDVIYDVKLPFTPKSVIVMAFEMDYAAMSTAPLYVSGATAAMEYSQMAITGASLRTFFNELGYKAFATGNDIALSIPYAISAGLGEAARNGILVTSQFGPRVRLAKVFTEMDLNYDKPISFGVRHFCQDCKLCADACPAKAISQERLPSFKVENECNNPGVEKWAIDAKKCLEGWGKVGSDCSTCIASCPYNKPDFWHHRMVDKVNKFMPESVHSVMREMDKLFGYGNLSDPVAAKDFWKNES
jgi:reductive dehalogenase